jgi:hypothetical protein
MTLERHLSNVITELALTTLTIFPIPGMVRGRPL